MKKPKNKKFVKTPDGEKIKLVKGKIRYEDRNKIIPGIPGVKKLREDIKKLKAYKVNKTQ